MSVPARRRPARVLAAGALSVTTTFAALAATAPPAWSWDPAAPLRAARPAPRYLHPVDAPVTVAFDAFDQPYGAGNRGLDYGVVPAMVVRAAASGRVVFAGPVAGRLFVTVQHLDGIRTSYSYLSRLDVRAGSTVRVGDRLGLTSGEFQLGMRRGDRYIDPAPLLGRTLLRRTRLVVPADSRAR